MRVRIEQTVRNDREGAPIQLLLETDDGRYCARHFDNEGDGLLDFGQLLAILEAMQVAANR